MYGDLAAELVRAARGKRPQAAMSRRLGFATNVVYAWESKRTAPTALQFLLLVEKSGVDTRSLVRSFYVRPPTWLQTMREFPSRAGVAAFLRDQRGQISIHDLAKLSGTSRFALSRWFKGTAEPKLRDVLCILHHATRRLLDWVALFVDPAALPTIAKEWEREQAARKAVYELPWTLAVLRALELAGYQRLGKHEPGWIAQRLGIEQRVEERALDLLASSGQIAVVNGLWRTQPTPPVNLRQDARAALAQRVFWSRVAADRAPADPGMFAYNVCSVSERDLDRLKKLQREFMQQARVIIADSQPMEQVALIQTQLFALSQEPPAAVGPP